MIIEAAKRIFNSDKICHSYSDLNFSITFLEHSVVFSVKVQFKLYFRHSRIFSFYDLQICTCSIGAKAVEYLCEILVKTELLNVFLYIFVQACLSQYLSYFCYISVPRCSCFTIYLCFAELFRDFWRSAWFSMPTSYFSLTTVSCSIFLLCNVPWCTDVDAHFIHHSFDYISHWSHTVFFVVHSCIVAHVLLHWHQRW